MTSFSFLVVLAVTTVPSVTALKARAMEPPPGLLEMSEHTLWKQAWSSAQEEGEGMPERVIYKNAEKLWKSWIQMKHHNQEEDSTFTESTTLGVMARLTAGLDSVDDEDTPRKETTTTTENVEAKRANDKAAAARQAAFAKLTEGMEQTRAEEIELATATTTTSSTTTSTTTTNTAFLKLLAGVNGPEPSTAAASLLQTTTTSTTTSTSKFVLDAAGRKTIAFISSGTFEFPHHQSEEATKDTGADDDDQKDQKEEYADSEAATDFDQYDN